MKKVLFITFIVIFFCNSSFSQSKSRFGFVAGVNYFSLRGDVVNDAESANGISYGVSYEYKFHNRLSFVTGLIIEQKNINYHSEFNITYLNSNFELASDDYYYITKNKFQYFTLPILLRFSFLKNNSVFINGGFFISTTGNVEKTTETKNLTQGYSFESNTQDRNNFPFANDIEGFDYGVSFGLGKSFDINKKSKISLELRNNLGLVNLIDNINKYGNTGNIKTNTISLILNWSFNL